MNKKAEYQTFRDETCSQQQFLKLQKIPPEIQTKAKIYLGIHLEHYQLLFYFFFPNLNELLKTALEIIHGKLLDDDDVNKTVSISHSLIQKQSTQLIIKKPKPLLFLNLVN